jgi:hypothetical protein
MQTFGLYSTVYVVTLFGSYFVPVRAWTLIYVNQRKLVKENRVSPEKRLQPITPMEVRDLLLSSDIDQAEFMKELKRRGIDRSTASLQGWVRKGAFPPRVNPEIVRAAVHSVTSASETEQENDFPETTERRKRKLTIPTGKERRRKLPLEPEELKLLDGLFAKVKQTNNPTAIRLSAAYLEMIIQLAESQPSSDNKKMD